MFGTAIGFSLYGTQVCYQYLRFAIYVIRGIRAVSYTHLITVDSDTVHQVEEETGKFIVVIEQYNDEAVGSLTIHKKGEKLSGASKVEEKFLTKMKNGVAGFVNQVSSFFTCLLYTSKICSIFL